MVCLRTSQFIFATTVCVILLDGPSGGAVPKLPLAAPEEVGVRSAPLARIDTIVEEGLRENRMPGCVVAMGRHGKLFFLKAYGHKQLAPESLPMTTDTVFDMASITKPVATATSVMILVERGQLRLRNRASDYIPEFGTNGKQHITITELLTHHGGLIPDNALRDYDDGPEVALTRINELDMHVPRGTKFVYTDVGYIVLGEIVRRVTGQNIHEFSRDGIFAPLDMTDTEFLPRDELKARAAPTEKRDDRWIQGEVHDPRSYRLNGIAGHAGLFSTAEDLAVYAQMMLQEGSYGGVRIMSPLTVAEMTQARDVSGNMRALGWDKQSVYSSNRAELFSDQAFGHGGFTGTVMWIDPQLDMFFIFLSNRVHPDGRGNVNSLAGRLATVACAAIDDQPPTACAWSGDVQTGLDQLVQGRFRSLKDQRVGLITNHTGIDRLGRQNVALLRESPNVDLVAVFSPEHGFSGASEQATIDDSIDTASGLRVFSLYGETRKPTAAQLSRIDTLVFDIQDIGTRYYTYVSTMGLAMQAAAEHGKRFVVLDRPNPVNGVAVQGPVLDEGKQSFVGFHTLPVRHGMTVGELAAMFKSEMRLDLDLRVIQMKNWRRSSYFDQTGLIWINPSPNMRNLNQAILYPGVGLLETTNLSVGRGTDTPFERIGAPWIDGVRLARTLNQARLPGVKFTPIIFRPKASLFRDETCQGVQILITDRGRIHPLMVGFEIATTLRSQYPEAWKFSPYERLLADEQVMSLVTKGEPAQRIQAAYQGELLEFRQRRGTFLLY